MPEMTDELSPAQVDAIKADVMTLECYGGLWVTAEEYAEATKPGRVIWADGPPPDGADGEWLVDGAWGAIIAEWGGRQWESEHIDYDPREITRHARLE